MTHEGTIPTKSKFCRFVLLSVLLAVSTLPALAVGPGDIGAVYWADNGHWYAWIPGTPTWQQARDAAAGTFLDLPGGTVPGYLATITSAEEQDFIHAQFPAAALAGAFLGGYGVDSGYIVEFDAPTVSVCVSIETGPATNEFEFAGGTGVIDGTAWTVAEYYSYDFPETVSYNGDKPGGASGGVGPPAISNGSQLFLVKTSDAPSAALFVVHDQTNDGSGGFVSMTFQLAGDTASFMVRDDPGEIYMEDLGGTRFRTSHNWIQTKTDGVVIGDLAGNWDLRAAFYRNISANGGSLTSWQLTGPDYLNPIHLPDIPPANWSYGEGTEWDYYREVLLEACDITAEMDIKFCSDPNAFQCKKKGVLPVTLFGREDFDVHEVDLETVALCSWADVDDCVPLVDSFYEDRGNPETDLGAGQCALIEEEEQRFLNRDDIPDLELIFDSMAVGELIGCADLDRKTASDALVVKGYFNNGIFFMTTPVYDVGIDQLEKR